MDIKILGTGCSKCVSLETKVNNLVKEKNITASVEKISELKEIMKYGVMSTPGLVINNKVVSYGYIPKDEQIFQWINEAK